MPHLVQFLWPCCSLKYLLPSAAELFALFAFNMHPPACSVSFRSSARAVVSSEYFVADIVDPGYACSCVWVHFQGYRKQETGGAGCSRRAGRLAEEARSRVRCAWKPFKHKTSLRSSRADTHFIGAVLSDGSSAVPAAHAAGEVSLELIVDVVQEWASSHGLFDLPDTDTRIVCCLSLFWAVNVGLVLVRTTQFPVTTLSTTVYRRACISDHQNQAGRIFFLFILRGCILNLVVQGTTRTSRASECQNCYKRV